MDFETVCAFLLTLPAATEDYPFDEKTAVFRVGKKMFALVASDETPVRISLKCDPEQALALRQQYAAVVPGYHLNKQHWNTVTLDGTIPSDEIDAMMRDSYDLIVKSLKKSDRDALFAP